MKTQIFSIMIAFMLFSYSNVFAQIQPKKVKTKTVETQKINKKTPLSIDKKNSINKEQISKNINSKNKRNCLPIETSRLERVITDKIAKDLSLYLDKDYGSIEIMGEKADMAIGKYKMKKPGNNWHYHLNDIKSTVTRVSRNGAIIALNVYFEDESSEIKGKCPGCRIGNDKRAPDLQWENPKLLIVLKPVAYNGLLTFDVDKVEMKGKLKMNGPMSKFMPSISKYFRSRIETLVENQIKQTLNKPEIKNMLSNAFKPEVNRLRLGKVVSVDDSKDKIYLCNY